MIADVLAPSRHELQVLCASHALLADERRAQCCSVNHFVFPFRSLGIAQFVTRYGTSLVAVEAQVQQNRRTD